MPEAWTHGLIGGCLIGLASLWAMAATGKVPGISGVFGRLFRPDTSDRGWRVLFLIGLVAAAAVVVRLSGFAAIYRLPEGRNLVVYGIAGLLVGFGTRLGGGCTSGHGVCGNGMGVRDSMVATGVFMVAGIATVFVFGLLR